MAMFYTFVRTKRRYDRERDQFTQFALLACEVDTDGFSIRVVRTLGHYRSYTQVERALKYRERKAARAEKAEKSPIKAPFQDSGLNHSVPELISAGEPAL